MTSKTNFSKILRQFSWIMIGRIFGAILQAIIVIWLARDVGPNTFGLFSVVYGLATVAQVSLDLGLSAFIIRERARNSRSLWISRALRLYDYLALILSVVSLAGLYLAGTFIDPAFLMLIPLGIWVAVERNTDAWLGVALADGDVHINTSNLILRRLLALGLYAALNRADVDPLFAFSLSLAISSVISLSIVRPIIARRIPQSSYKLHIRRILKLGWPFWLNSLGAQLRNLDAVIVTSIAGPAQAGLYGAAARVAGPLNMISASLATVLLPTSTGKTTQAVRKLLRWCLLFIVGLGFIYAAIVLWTPEIVNTLLGKDYTGAVLPIRIIIAGLIFSSMASIFTAVLQGSGRQHYVAYISITSTGVCLALIVLGSLHFGAIGAAAGLALSYILHCTLLTIGLKKLLTEDPTILHSQTKNKSMINST